MKEMKMKGFNIQAMAVVVLHMGGNVLLKLEGRKKVVSLAPGEVGWVKLGDKMIVEGPDRWGFFHTRIPQSTRPRPQVVK